MSFSDEKNNEKEKDNADNINNVNNNNNNNDDDDDDDDDDICKACISRRNALKWIMGATAVTVAGGSGAVFATVKTPASKKKRQEIAAGDHLVYAIGPKSQQYIKMNDLPVGKGMLAFPKGKEEHLNLIMLIREKKSMFYKPTHLNWVLPDGYVTYSAICTHMGCTVLWHPGPQPPAPFPHIFCPCHQSMFDIFHGAKVVSGPAPRPLPQLPIIANSKNEIVANGDFDGPPGPLPGGGEKWHGKFYR